MSPDKDTPERARHPEHMRRNRWHVDFSAECVLTSCEERIAYHNERRRFWQVEHGEAERRLNGTEPRLFQTRRAGLPGIEETDENLIAEIAACLDRIHDNYERLQEYTAFSILLRRMPPTTKLYLTSDDIAFFNIGGYVRTPTENDLGLEPNRDDE
jgi:hypothetical protein